jgi:hypothetical protein
VSVSAASVVVSSVVSSPQAATIHRVGNSRILSSSR